MARVPIRDREQLSPQGKAVYDQIAGSRGSVSTNFKALLNSPELAARLSHLGAYLRFEGPVPNHLKEVAALVAARQTDGHYVWTAHETLARRAGVKDEVINAIRSRGVPAKASPEELAIARYAWAFLRDHRVDDKLFQEVQGYLGVQGIVDLTLFISYYAAISLATSAFGIDTEPGVKSTLPV